MRHELHLARSGFAALAAVALVTGGLGLVVAGRSGAVSALIGVGLIGLNHAIAVGSTAWSRTIDARVFAVGFGVFVFRMLLLLGLFGSLQTIGWLHDGFLAGAFGAALFTSLAAECVSYARGSYVPAWRTR